MSKTGKKNNNESDIVIVDYITKINSAITELKNSIGGNCLIAFRAEDKDYGEGRIKPSIFRKNVGKTKEIELNTKNILMDYGFIDNNKNSLYYPIEAQHYGLPSRLVDITFNVLVALYFVASNPNHLKENGVIYVFAFPEYFSPNDTNISQLYEAMLEDKNPIVDKNFKVLTHCKSNERIKAQNGGFIMFLGDNFHQIPKAYYRAIPVEKVHYVNILDSLKTLFGITEYNIYPEEDKMKTVPYDRKIQYSNEFGSQIDEYQNRVSFEVDCTFERNNKLRKIRLEKKYLEGLLVKYSTNLTGEEKKSISKAMQYLDFLKIKAGGSKNEQ